MRSIFLCIVVSLAVSPAMAQKVTLDFENGKFPMRLGHCLALKVTGPFDPFKQMEFIEQAEGTLPAGETVVWTTASSTYGYFVSVQYSTDGKTWSKATHLPKKISLGDKDVLRVKQIEIIPPDNAALAPYKGGQILVSTMFPVAIPNPPDFKGKEEFRSTAMFLAKYGDRAIARALAKYALANVATPSGWNARNDQQISVTFLVNRDGKVIPAQTQGSEEQLTDAIETGVRNCRKKQLRIGTTFDEQIKKAEELLKK